MVIRIPLYPSAWKDTIQFQHYSWLFPEIHGSHLSYIICHYDASWYSALTHQKASSQVTTSLDRKLFLQALSILMHCIGVSRLDGWLFLVSFGCLEFGTSFPKKGTDDDDDDDDDDDEKFYVIPIWLKLLQSSWLKRASLGKYLCTATLVLTRSKRVLDDTSKCHYSSVSSALFLNVFFEKSL